MSSPKKEFAENQTSAEMQGSQEATIEQVRELLFGNKQREIEQVTTAHQTELQRIEQSFEAQVSQLRSELVSLERTVKNNHNESIGVIAKAIDQLGSSVKGLIQK